jgi:hypothetical protein
VLIEPLSRSEMRMLRYLPANPPAPDIARELSMPVTIADAHKPPVRHVRRPPHMTAVISLSSCRAKYQNILYNGVLPGR